MAGLLGSQSMFVSGFTIVRNAILYDYPIVESLRSLLPMVDELVVAVGDSNDQTRASVASIGSSKLRIIDTVWDEQLRRGGEVLAQQTNLALAECRGDWAFYLQADEVLHEQDYERIREAMQHNLHRRQIQGLSFRYHHFRADYAIRDPLPYRRQIRIVRPGIGVRSCGDACGFEIGQHKLRAVGTGAWVYHYGYVKPPKRMAAKMDYFISLYDGRVVLPNEQLQPEDYQWDLRTCEPFTQTHPHVMLDRIAAKDWPTPNVQLIPRWRNSRFWSGMAHKNSSTFRRWAHQAREFASGLRRRAA